MPTIITTTTDPDNILKTKCTGVTNTFILENGERLKYNMLRDCRAANGIGLAAPQIGYTIQAFVLDIPNLTGIFFNPKIHQSKTNQKYSYDYEACLSVPGKQVQVKRMNAISLTYRDEHTQEHTIELSGLPARAVQHECDHLKGITI